MTKIGLVSDSHGDLNKLQEAINQMGDVDLIIHMGDYISDADEIRTWVNIPVMAVKGNMDSYEQNRPDFIKTNVEDFTLYIAHGNRENVKWGKEEFAQKAKMNGADIGIFGHTHKKHLEKLNSVILINPGSVSLPSDDSKSYAILTLDGKDLDCEFYKLD